MRGNPEEGRYDNMKDTINWNTILSITAVCASLVAGYGVYTNSRNRELEAKARIAESEREKAHSLERAEIAKESAAKYSAEEAKRRAEAETSRAEAEHLAAKNQKLKLETEKEEAQKAADNKQTALLKAREAADALSAEKLRNDTAKVEADKAKSVAKLEAKKASDLAVAKERELELQKLKSESVIAEAKIRESRKIDFENWAALLYEKECELNEREKALMPEKTTADLQWVAERDADVIGQAPNAAKVKKPKLEENNPYLSRSTRELLKVERLNKEEIEMISGIVRDDIVKYLETKYEKAFMEDRMVDADYYKKALKSFYPQWKYTPVSPVEKSAEQEDLTRKEAIKK